MKVKFSKYHGTGNDFIIIKDLDSSIESALNVDNIEALCNRRIGIGADGLILIQRHPEYDFKMVYFNSDGQPSSMCGNGGRCSAWYAYKNAICKADSTFMAIDGVHSAHCHEEPYVDLEMRPVDIPQEMKGDFIIDTGSPHYVKFVDDFDFDVVDIARKIRYADSFKQAGINVNFVKKSDHDLYVRTYERGVEDETLSCGTGVTASALVSAYVNGHRLNNINVNTLGGALKVKYGRVERGQYQDVWLSGPVKEVYEGAIII